MSTTSSLIAHSLLVTPQFLPITTTLLEAYVIYSNPFVSRPTLFLHPPPLAHVEIVNIYEWDSSSKHLRIGIPISICNSSLLLQDSLKQVNHDLHLSFTYCFLTTHFTSSSPNVVSQCDRFVCQVELLLGFQMKGRREIYGGDMVQGQSIKKMIQSDGNYLN